MKRFAQAMNEVSSAGVILFSESPYNSIKIGDFKSTRHFMDDLRKLQPIGSITRIDKGLNQFRHNAAHLKNIII